MKITLTSILVDDQEKALRFYTDALGFVKKTDTPVGEHRWLTVVSPEAPDGPELLLEPDEHPAARPFNADYERLAGLGVHFTQPPAQMGPVRTAVLDDTCGNLIQIAAPA
jgi:catechol 2,3-dioxygenase-like lactoylglutathione lyase family enzyme